MIFLFIILFILRGILKSAASTGGADRLYSEEEIQEAFEVRIIFFQKYYHFDFLQHTFSKNMAKTI